jgi:hypothetical protein
MRINRKGYLLFLTLAATPLSAPKVPVTSSVKDSPPCFELARLPLGWGTEDIHLTGDPAPLPEFMKTLAEKVNNPSHCLVSVEIRESYFTLPSGNGRWDGIEIVLIPACAFLGFCLWVLFSASQSSSMSLLKNDSNALFSACFASLLDVRASDAIIGDLNERFLLIQKSYGNHEAYLWYRSQVFSSIAPIVWAAFVRRFNHFSRRT